MFLPRLIALAAVVCLFIAAWCLYQERQDVGVVFLAAGAAFAMTEGFLFYLMVRRDRMAEEYCPFGHLLPRNAPTRAERLPDENRGGTATVWYGICPTCLELREKADALAEAEAKILPTDAV